MIIALYGTAHPIPDCTPWTACWYTCSGFRELRCVLISESTECLTLPSLFTEK